MFFIVLPNKRVVKFFNSVMLIDLFKYFFDYSFVSFFKVNGFFVKNCFLIKKNSVVKFYKDFDKIHLFIVSDFYKYLMSNSIKLFFPFSILSTGFVCENTFFYDFEFEFKLSSSFLERLEKKMNFLLEINVLSSFFLLSNFTNKNSLIFNDYKMKHINYNDEIYIYKYGSYLDLCFGSSFDYLVGEFFFKLLKLSGAYWMGNSSNIMLQRVEGIVFHKYENLCDYILSYKNMNDHRVLGKKYDLFHFQQDSGGVIFWHKNGWIIYQEILKYLRFIFSNYNYMEVNTPQLINKNLWEMSGHLDKFCDNMYIVYSDNDIFVLKPMNCPAHAQIFKNSIKSYKDLPVKYCEFGSCHRKEFSGSLHGIMRVRNFVQDDGHIFCLEEQLQKEVTLFIKSLFVVYKKFLFTDILIKVSTRPDKRVGSDILWDKAEEALVFVLNNLKLKYLICFGEGAFYGPKIEFTLKDSIGRFWQCGTIQIDFFIPKRLDVRYFNKFGNKQFPIMIHRAIIGSVERFLGILLESCFDNFPLWLCPIQVIVLNITFNEILYSKQIFDLLKNENIRVGFDFKNDKISLKVRNAIVKKIPYLLIIGKKEFNDKLVSVRTKNFGKLGVMDINAFINMFKSCLSN